MKRSFPSDATECVSPIKLFRATNNLANKMDLHKFCQEKCDFCEELFFCQYDMLIHNAKHIIIPLRDEVAQCSQCDRYFPTAIDLEIHTKVDHFQVPDILAKIVMSKPVVQCDNSVTELLIQEKETELEKLLKKTPVIKCDTSLTEIIKEKNCETLKGFILKQPIIRCEDTVKELILEKVNKNEYKKDESIQPLPKLTIKKDLLTKNYDFYSVSSISDVMKTNNVNKDTTSQMNGEMNGSNFRNRIIFEDGSDYEDDIISTQTNGLKTIPDNDICDLTLDDSDIEADNTKNDTINIITNYTETIEKKAAETAKIELVEKFSPSIHYEDLIEEMPSKCRACGLSFNNRYDLIVHEARKHIKIKKLSPFRSTRVCLVCDRYIVGNHWTVKSHMEKKHPDFSKMKYCYNLKDCPKCKLKYYIYHRHSVNYHFIYKCPTCTKSFENESLLSEHRAICNISYNSIPEIFEERIGMQKIIKVCELCSLFFKNTQTYKYVPLRDHSVPGQRITCERCEKKFFEVKLVKLINKHPIVQPFYEYKPQARQASSNEKRLKNIQKRLKMIKFKNSC